MCSRTPVASTGLLVKVRNGIVWWNEEDGMPWVSSLVIDTSMGDETSKLALGIKYDKDHTCPYLCSPSSTLSLLVIFHELIGLQYLEKISSFVVIAFFFAPVKERLFVLSHFVLRRNLTFPLSHPRVPTLLLLPFRFLHVSTPLGHC